jgi:hypothetical protein
VFVVQLAGPHGFVDPVFNSRRHHVHLVVRIRVLEIAQAQDHRPRLVGTFRLSKIETIDRFSFPIVFFSVCS